MARALLTGFAPFRHWAENSSQKAAEALAGRAGLAVEILPVDHDAACAALEAALTRHAPQVALLAGLADEPRLRLELLARRPAHRQDGPETARGLWPWAEALDAMRAAGAPARLSRDAGRYVCETAYWRALALRPAMPTAFLHVPPLSDDWPAERTAAAMAACLGVCDA
jgi:pyroglutamyl-peptidase